LITIAITVHKLWHNIKSFPFCVAVLVVRAPKNRTLGHSRIFITGLSAKPTLIATQKSDKKINYIALGKRDLTALAIKMAAAPAAAARHLATIRHNSILRQIEKPYMVEPKFAVKIAFFIKIEPVYQLVPG